MNPSLQHLSAICVPVRVGLSRTGRVPPSARSLRVPGRSQDLGWNDIGFHNSHIDSPNIDALASVGIELTDYHVYKVCSPTRAAIMTGRLPNRAGLHNFISHDKPDAISDRYILLPQALKAKGCELRCAHASVVGTRLDKVTVSC